MRTRSVTKKEEGEAAIAARNLPELPPEVLQLIFNYFVETMSDASDKDTPISLEDQIEPFAESNVVLGDLIRGGLIIAVERKRALAEEFYEMIRKIERCVKETPVTNIWSKDVARWTITDEMMSEYMERCAEEGISPVQGWYRRLCLHQDITMRPPFKLEDCEINHGMTGHKYLIVIQPEDDEPDQPWHDLVQAFWDRSKTVHRNGVWNDPGSLRLALESDFCEPIDSFSCRSYKLKDRFRTPDVRLVRFRSAVYSEPWMIECAGWEAEERAANLQACADRLENATRRAPGWEGKSKGLCDEA